MSSSYAAKTSPPASESADAFPSTFPELIARNGRVFADRPAYREKEYGVWQSWTWAEAEEEIRALALGYLTLGVQPGDHIAVAGRNRPYFYWAMLAAQMVGAIPTPLYQDAVADELAYVLENCGARFVVVGDQEQVDKILDTQERLPILEQIIYFDPRGMRRYDHTRLHQYRAMQNAGRAAAAEHTPELERRIAAIDPSGPCVMLYTSGTTGRPKGVVLSHSAIIATSRATVGFDGLNERDSALAYLPMAWVGDFIFSMGQATASGFCVCCPEKPDTMRHDLREIGPTYFFAPPRFFEGLLTSVMIRMEDAGWIKRKMFHYFMNHAKRVGPKILDGESVGLIARAKYTLGRAFVYGPLLDALGLGRVRVGYTAGEAIGPEIFEFYRSLGMNLKQLYGQTEASVFITQQPDGQVRADTVGTPTPGVEIRIADNGEVFYRSPGSFTEYFKNPESTADTKDPEGWIATGDAGFIEPDTGHLRILDRAKDVGKLAGGGLFAPKYIENKLKFFPSVLEAVVFGDGRDQCAAFVNIDMTAVGDWAERNNIAYASYQELAGHPRVAEQIRACVEDVNVSVAADPMLAQCQISRFLVLHKELDADDGELTRTRKVRRRVIEEKYADLVTALYDGTAELSTSTEVTYEDGRKGAISATLRLHDAATAQTQEAAA